MSGKPLLLLILLYIPFVTLIAQPRHGANEISGKIMCSQDKLPMPMVAVGVEELNIWTVTNMDGTYLLKNIPSGKFQLTVRCLGYTTQGQEFVVPGQEIVNVNLTPASLALGEVVVTAQRGTGIATSTTIGRSAIEHTQPSSITDIMQLLPGEVSRNPNLNSSNQLSIRENTGTHSSQSESGPSAMGSLGTGLRIDGAPVSNNANMQTLNSSGGGSFHSTAMQGVDMRQFSVDNIESIEVVRGIPGVEEGNVLSGVVHVNLIKGATPLTTRVKVDPSIKQAYMGKGFNLGGFLGGTINFDGDFQQSLSDIRTPYESYNRISSYFAYNNTFFRESRPLRFTFSARYNDQRNRRVDDPDRFREESFSSHDRALALIMSGGWALKSKLLTNLNWNVSGNFQSQDTREKKLPTVNGVQTLAVSEIAGEHEAIYIMQGYYSDVVIEGRPMYLNARLNGTRSFSIGRSQHIIRTGMDYSYSVNKGQGSIFDRSQPPDPNSGSGVRPRPFYDIPASVNLSFFLGEELSIPFGSTELNLHAGIRFENLQPDGPFSSSEGITSLDPRINARYTILKKHKHLISDLGLRLGYGRTTLTPSLMHMYPDKIYRDLSSFNYYDPPHPLAVMTTLIQDDTRNYELTTARSSKFEAGLDITIGRADMQFTGYFEQEVDGFSLNNSYYPVEYKKYQSLTQPNLSPEFIPGVGVVYNDPETGVQVVVPYTEETILRSHSYPTNGLDLTKMGLEVDIDFGKVEMLQTSFMINGAYRYTHRQDTEQWYATNSNVRDLVVGLYPEGNEGKVHERITASLRTVTHIRPLALIVSLTAQAFLLERTQSTYEDSNGNIIPYTLNPSGNVYRDITQQKYINPISVMDLSGNLKPWLPEYANIMPYSALIRNRGNEYYMPMSYGPSYQFNMRLTKELSKNATISFSVNNITYYQPLQQGKGRVNSVYTRRNSKTYFSGELTIKI